jgi:hypothetical protein
VKLKFFSMQNMSQEWGPEGVDGARIAAVEFSDTTRVDLSDEALAPMRAEVEAKLTSPGLFLTARYD